jgi:hypothetical protein
MAKKEYKNVMISDKVEQEYLYATLLGSDLLPFCHLPFRVVVLPIRAVDNSFNILDKDAVQAGGHGYMYQWLSKVENYWKQIRADKFEKMNVYQWLNYSKKLTKQSPKARYTILYTGAGRGNMSSSIIESGNIIEIRLNDIQIQLNGFICEHDTYYYYPNSKDEANFLSSILNSDFTFSILKRIKSARHIQKKVLELPIPEFDSQNSAHVQLSVMGNDCAMKAKRLLHEELHYLGSTDSLQTGTIGSLRRRIKGKLSNEMDQIDKLVASLFSVSV